jgi:hypothetical protein
MEKERVEEGDERTALLAISLITDSEFRDGGLSCRNCDDGYLCHVEMSRELVASNFSGRGRCQIVIP